uniref:Odorant receptor n=1 Tax=Epiphyas postvittana TaxID=65032 RepID=A0A0K8TVC9_EPIPO
MDALELRYVQRIRFTLGTVGAWPSHVFEDNPSKKWAVLRRYGYTSVLCILCGFGMVAQAMYLKKYKSTLQFINLGHTCLTLLMSCVFCQRTTLPLFRTYRETMKDFFLRFHLSHHKYTSEFSLQTCNRVNRFCEIATIIQHVQLYTAAFLFNTVQHYQNYKSGMFNSDKSNNGTYEHAVAYYLPFDQSTGVGFTVICIYNFYVSFNFSVIFCCHDLVICVIVFHIWGHMHIFEHDLNFFRRPNAVNGVESLKYSCEENIQVALGLKEIVKRYIMIKEFLSNTSEAYSVTLCVYFGFHLVTDCVLLLECSSLDPTALGMYGMTTFVVYQLLIQLSVVFEIISSKGDALIDAVYGLPWECMDISNRRTVLILLQIVQQPLSLKACGMVPVGVQTMLTVIKASFSYFMMLRTFAN